MVTPESICDWIEAGLPGANATVTGDGHHFEAVIIYEGFHDKSMIQQHRMVYDVLGDKMKNAIHALSMKTYAQEQINT
jgi:acid stress-induced BolA-like protein IbaG/YrbA